MIFYKALKQIEIYSNKLDRIILRNELFTHYELEIENLLPFIDLFDKVSIPADKTTNWKNHRILKTIAETLNKLEY